MIVCSCNVLTDHAIRAACSSLAPQTPGQVYRCLGCSPQCGRCMRTVRALLDEARAAACPASCAACPAHGDSQADNDDIDIAALAAAE